ncbi:MAG TPA: GDP-mannose 4,6-dehydratase [Blastocatellia bacterium]|nr:GDP-mannose 4,6-dehydratase [Blastocatellia bacterium]
MNNFNTSFWRERPVLVTGATGLLGSWLTRALIERGASVVALIRDWVPENELFRSGALERVTIVRGDVRDQEAVERALGEYEIDTVFHLAAQTIVGIANRNPISTFESNIRGTWVMLEACRRSPLVNQIIVASSDKAYGHHEQLPYREDAALKGRHPYDVSKSCADLIAKSYAVTYGLPVCVTRCGNLFGGGDLNWNRIVPGTIRSALRGERPIIRSDGSHIRDYFYVEDGALAYITLAEQLAARRELAGEAFNFSNEIQMTVLELARMILRLAGRDELELDVRAEAKNEINHQYLDASKAREALGWHPHFSLEEGLARTIEWYREFFNHIRVPDESPSFV